MITWYTLTLAMCAVTHFLGYGFTRLAAGYIKNYTIWRTVLGYFGTLLLLPLLIMLSGRTPAALVGTFPFFSASVLLSIAALWLLGTEIDRAAIQTKENMRATMNRIAGEGFDAFKAGEPITANPYASATDPESRNYSDYWSRGFKLAEGREKNEGG